MMIKTNTNARWMLLPWFTGFVFLTCIPFITLIVLSVIRTDGGMTQTESSWIGLDHYQNALRMDHHHIPKADDPWYWSVFGGKPNDPLFYKSLYNSLCYTLLAVPLGLLSSLMVALLLHGQRYGASLVRTFVYIPHLLSGVATIVIWSWLLNPQFGWLNQAILFVYHLLDPFVRLFFDTGTINWTVPDWLYSPLWCKLAVILMHVWTMGGAMLIFLAALKRIPETMYDAAGLDGANILNQFRHVTWPVITPVVLFNLIISLIFAMQSFSEAYMLQNRQQEDGLLFYVLYVYRTAFDAPYQMGYASALSLIFIIVMLVLVLPLIWTSRRWVYEAGKL